PAARPGKSIQRSSGPVTSRSSISMTAPGAIHVRLSKGRADAADRGCHSRRACHDAAMIPPDEAPPEGAEAQEVPYTAWHYLVVQTMEALIDPSLLTILAFQKLGTLPLEADVILLLKERDGPELAELVPDFDFLLRRLARL